MTPEQLNDLGERMATSIAVGILHGVAAGAAKFEALAEAIGRNCEEKLSSSGTTALFEMADRIEQERQKVTAQIETTTGLRQAALKRRLAELNEQEAKMVRLLAFEPEKQPTAIEQAAQADTAETITVPVNRLANGKFAARNGTTH